MQKGCMGSRFLGFKVRIRLRNKMGTSVELATLMLKIVHAVLFIIHIVIFVCMLNTKGKRYLKLEPIINPSSLNSTPQSLDLEFQISNPISSKEA